MPVYIMLEKGAPPVYSVPENVANLRDGLDSACAYVRQKMGYALEHQAFKQKGRFSWNPWTQGRILTLEKGGQGMVKGHSSLGKCFRFTFSEIASGAF